MYVFAIWVKKSQVTNSLGGIRATVHILGEDYAQSFQFLTYLPVGLCLCEENNIEEMLYLEMT